MARPSKTLSRQKLQAALVDRLGVQHRELAAHLAALGVLVWTEAHNAPRRIDARTRKADAAILRQAARVACRYAAEAPFPLRDMDPPLEYHLDVLAASITDDAPRRGGQEAPALALLIAGVATTCARYRFPLRITEGGAIDQVFEVLAPLATKGVGRPDWRTRRGYIERARRTPSAGSE